MRGATDVVARRTREAGSRRGRAEPPIRFADPGLIRDRVVDALRDAIVAGRVPPGERIRERQLVDLIGVSRSPLREAIRVLEGEGFITSLPHRGARVSELSAGDLAEMVSVRIMLETFAARLALDGAADDTVRALEEQVARARAAGPGVAAATDFRLALEFHDLLVAASGNRRLLQLHENVKQHYRRYQHFAFARLGRNARAMDEHAAIIDAVRRRDCEAVQRAIQAHLLRFRDEIAPLLPVAPDRLAAPAGPGA